MIRLFNHYLIVEHLSGSSRLLKTIAGAAAFAKAATDLKQVPAAYVLPVSERPGRSNTGTMSVTQQNTVQFAIVIAVQNLRDPRGESAQADLLPIRNEIMTALHGWQPDSDMDPVEFNGGRLLRITGQALWWQDEFTTRHFIRSL
jgi:hypothetical protein